MIGVLGPKGTFTDYAASWYVQTCDVLDEKTYYPTIWEVFEALNNGKVKKGIVPIENSIHGTVRETFDELFNSNLKIECKFSIPIHLCLAINKRSRMESIKKIVSHQQALHQAGRYVRKQYPKAQRIGFSSTTSAINSLLRDEQGEKAVICSKKAAEKHQLHIIKENIEDDKENKTWFAVLALRSTKQRKMPAERMVTSIAFHFKEDSPGTLFTVFKDFNDAHLNMTKIESRPAPKKWGNYIFFLDFEGTNDDLIVKQTLQKVRKKVALLKNFGSYPAHDGSNEIAQW